MGKLKDLVGQRFGALTVIERDVDYVSPNGSAKAVWKCKCDCGNEVSVWGAYLNGGQTKSCGCLRRRKRIENVVDIEGKRYGRLVVEKFLRTEPELGAIWECKCDCGNTIEISGKRLRRGQTKSCGCLKQEKLRTNGVKHGGAYSRLYTVWAGMKQRCSNPAHKSYKDYGGRGINVCEEWDDFGKFHDWALENGYNDEAQFGECTLDRIDVDGNYEPNNCRWVTLKEQASNKRNSAH